MLKALFSTALRLSRGLGSRWRNFYFRALGVRFGGYVWMRRVEISKNHDAIAIGPGVALDDGVCLLAVTPSDGSLQIEIGAETYLNRRCFIDASESVTVGARVAMGPGCYLTDHDHGMEIGVPILAQPLVSAPTVVEDDVWLGAGVTVLKGVTIGAGTVVAAGSVVTKSLPPRVIAAGAPAKILRERA